MSCFEFSSVPVFGTFRTAGLGSSGHQSLRAGKTGRSGDVFLGGKDYRRRIMCWGARGAESGWGGQMPWRTRTSTARCFWREILGFWSSAGPLQFKSGGAGREISGVRRFVGRAPGRLDLMGGSAAFAGGLVVETTILEGVWASLALREDRQDCNRQPAGAQLGLGSAG